MKYLLMIFAVILAVAAVIILLMLLYTFAGWLNGAGNVLFPGMGLVVSADFLLLVLLALEIITVSVLALFVRYIFKR